MLVRIGWVAVATLALASCNSEKSAIRVTGSSTVFPFTTMVGDAFAQQGHDAPSIEETGTIAGFKAFCESSGTASIDVAQASRRMKRTEFAQCQKAKVGDLVEVPIGLDGVAFAESTQGPKLTLTRKDIYLALAANPMGKPNTAKTWHDVDAKLPAIPIRLLGPPTTSGTRDAFVDLLLEPGCLDAMPQAKALQQGADPAAYGNVCRQIRADGAYVTEGENDSTTVQKLERDPNTVGLFGYSYLEENAQRLRGVPVDGVEPTATTIASGKYPGMRTLYLYVKARNLKKKKDLQAFLDLYATMWAPNGPLDKHGLVVLPEGTRTRAKQSIDIADPLDQTALL